MVNCCTMCHVQCCASEMPSLEPGPDFFRLNSPSATCGWDLWYAGGGVDGANGSQALPRLRHNYVAITSQLKKPIES